MSRRLSPVSRSPRPARRARSAGLALAVAATAAATAMAAAVPGAAVSRAAAAAPPPDGPGSSAACPVAWTGPLAEDQAVTGLTTVRGTTPESFAGTYVDTIPNGIGRGRDMLIFRLSGSRITGAGGEVDAGVWAGISGSPLYDAGTGALVGAVSYGRSMANDVIAGVTPAADMYDQLLDDGSADRGDAPAVVALPRAARGALVDDGVPVRRSSSLRRLDSPTYVSGTSPERARSVAKRARRADATYVAGVAAAPTGPELPIVAGGNIATSWSHGDITMAGIGSVTAVCGEQVLAFGHPGAWAGESRESLHGARALGIASEGGYGAFKDVAEIGAPVGALTQDRLEGIAGTLGSLPPSVDIRSTVTRGGEELTGHSVVSEPDVLPDVVAMQAFDDVLTAVNAYYPTGEALLRWTVSFDVAGGGSRTYTRTQRYSDRSDLYWDVTGDVAADVRTILDNPFREVTITDVEITDALRDAYRAHRIGRVQVLRGGRFRTVRKGQTIVVPRRRDVVVRTSFPPANRWSKVRTTTRITRYRVTRGAVGAGRLTLRGNASSGGGDLFFFFFDEGGSDLLSGLSEQAILFGGQAGPARSKPRNLAQLLDAMEAQPRGDAVSTSLAYPNARVRDGITVQSVGRRLPAIVRGSFGLRVRFR